METTNFNSRELWRKTYLYVFPLVVASGWVLRLYLGDVSLGQIQNSANSIHIPCIFHWLTDLDCPGCGITRSLIAMYLWSPLWSFYFHPLGPVFAALGAFYWLGLVHERIEKGFEFIVRVFNRHGISALLILAAWGVFRNF